MTTKLTKRLIREGDFVAEVDVRGERTLVDLADQFEVHPNQIQDWKKKLVADAEHVFGAGAIEAAHSERETQQLHAALVHGATRQGWSKGSDDAVTS